MVDDELSRGRETVKNAINSLRTGESTFEEILELSNLPDYSSLDKVKVLRFLSSLQGWTNNSAARAFLAYGLPLNISMSGAKNNDYYMKTISTLISSSPGSWQERVEAPRGWPWFGNVLDVVKQLDERSLPDEFREAARYDLGDDVLSHNSPENNTMQDTYSGGGDDDLDDIFGGADLDDDNDEDDDFLNDLLG